MSDLFLLADHYVHDLSPFLIQFGENFGIRWYGLAYVMGFLAAWWGMRWMVRIRACELTEPQVSDFITFAAILGVMVGGRLGYMLFYNLDGFLAKPWIFFHLLDGGMSSHGGIFGLIIFTWFYTWRVKVSWTGAGDNLCTFAPVGIFCGRMANFINGELYGHKTSGWWGVKFPSELADRSESGFTTSQVEGIAREAAQADPSIAEKVEELIAGVPWNQLQFALKDLLETTARKSAEVQEVLARHLNPRHPSQLYEAALEGVFLFVVLLTVRLRWKNLYHGILTGLFFLLYAIVRVLVENVRQPDASLIMGITRGQFYSLFMILIGAAFIVYAVIARRRNQLKTA